MTFRVNVSACVFQKKNLPAMDIIKKAKVKGTNECSYKKEQERGQQGNS